ncbi:MAG: helix-turn-helix transcriptional regulator [Deltaproteobacteria bacterium]|nr:helix-turn-helix transcriptional regulator [Deltaproteobacteria bacterium]
MLREKIKTEAQKQGLTVYKLAKLSGLQITQLNNYLKGLTDLQGENIDKILNVLKQSDEYIISVLKNRILCEYEKYGNNKNIDFSEMAARKIYHSVFNCV